MGVQDSFDGKSKEKLQRWRVVVERVKGKYNEQSEGQEKE